MIPRGRVAQGSHYQNWHKDDLYTYYLLHRDDLYEAIFANNPWDHDWLMLDVRRDCLKFTKRGDLARGFYERTCFLGDKTRKKVLPGVETSILFSQWRPAY